LLKLEGGKRHGSIAGLVYAKVYDRTKKQKKKKK
jgi:hypothetical protein